MRIEQQYQRSTDFEAISLEVYQKRRVARRKRVARRFYAKAPIVAVELMQQEFPGYTYTDLENDVFNRKIKKSKSFRHPKKRAFNWRLIRELVPGFFDKCTDRKPTQAVLYIELKERRFKVTISSVFYSENAQQIFRTESLIKILREGTLKQLLTHPAVLVQDIIEEMK